MPWIKFRDAIPPEEPMEKGEILFFKEGKRFVKSLTPGDILNPGGKGIRDDAPDFWAYLPEANDLPDPTESLEDKGIDHVFEASAIEKDVKPALTEESMDAAKKRAKGEDIG